jgi:hypothetical protein
MKVTPHTCQRPEIMNQGYAIVKTIDMDWIEPLLVMNMTFVS